MAAPILTAAQTQALFYILTHHETYDEIEGFKQPGAVLQYGYPFPTDGLGSNGDGKLSYAQKSSSPVLHMLLNTAVLTMPGARDISPKFWGSGLQGLLVKFAEADLSESYEKGTMGTRKTLATASSSIIEAIARGYLGGCPMDSVKPETNDYDLKNAQHLNQAWDDAIRGLVYGNLLDEISDWLSESNDLEGHSKTVQAAVDYSIIHLATLFHQVFILSPEGQYFLKLIENVHKMLPYGVMRQTLRMSNAATMMNAMMKLFLSKLSIGSISNWAGLTSNADDGMNLLQRIISMLMSWDSSEFRKTTEKAEKSKDGPSKECLAALKAHVQKTRSDREAIRAKALKQSKSIILAILETSNPELLETLSDSQHAQCLEYYSALLSMRDRDEITNVLCRQNPDVFTQTIRDGVAGFDPLIRAVHDKVDLREHIEDYQSFVDQFIKTSKPKKSDSKDDSDGPAYRSPSVEDYVELLRANRYMLYKWLHHVASKCPDVRDAFKTWAKGVLVAFRRRDTKDGIVNDAKADNETPSLNSREATMEDRLAQIFATLPDESTETVLHAIDTQAVYLASIADLSTSRMHCILKGQSESTSGPGIYLISWQSLLDSTLITPSTLEGDARHGKDVRHATTQGKMSAGAKDGWDGGAAARQEATASIPEAPNVDVVVEALGPAFKDLITNIGAASVR